MTRMRADIQCLRGWAILTVLLYHARLGPFDAGYLGVDIFFVISGFLITRQIASQLDAGRFSFAGFYARRVKRLAPAAFVVFLGAALAAPFLLTKGEFAQFRLQLLGAATLSGNIVLWRQTGYFGGAAEMKPLLHVWSLAIEEQYYLLAPALLFVTPRRYWLTGAIVATLASLALCAMLAPIKPTAAFYLLPTRAWELGAGSIGALAHVNGAAKRIIAVAFIPALAALLLFPAFPLAGAQPGLASLLMCAATIIIILRHADADRLRPLASLGDVSYSLYLVHWPLLAFLNNASLGETPPGLRIVAVMASLTAAALLYRFVEQPFRHAAIGDWRAIGLGATSSLLLALTPLASGVATPTNAMSQPNFGLSEACDYKTDFAPTPECRSGVGTGVLLWGDSYAMHLAPALLGSTTQAPLLQATRRLCGPTLGLAAAPKPGTPIAAAGFNRDTARACLDFNDSVAEFLDTAPEVETVLLASHFGYYLDANQELLAQDGASAADPRDALIASMQRTIARVRRSGKKVVVIGPPAGLSGKIGACLERMTQGKPIIGPYANCNIPRAASMQTLAPIRNVLAQLEQTADVATISFDDALCDATQCRAKIDATPLFQPDGHLTTTGARLLGERMDLMGRVRMQAR